MYKVLEAFTDIQDNNHIYRTGDTFPRDGVVASKERLAELYSDNNKRGIPLIEYVEEKPKPEKKTAGRPKSKKTPAKTAKKKDDA